MEAMINRLAESFKGFHPFFSTLDILIISAVYFGILLFLRKNNLLGILKFLIIIVVAGVLIVAYSEYMPVSSGLVTGFFSGGLLIAVVVYSADIKRGVLKLSSAGKVESQYVNSGKATDEELHECVEEMVKGIITLAKNNVGALILLSNHNIPSQIIQSGTRLNSLISEKLLECIFNTKAPLHDGAIIVEGNYITAAGCFLPLTQNLNLPKDFGTRHRAGIGITETVDTTAIIVSEETGVISVAKKGELTRYYDKEMLTDILQKFYGLKAVTKTSAGRRRRK